MSANGNLVAARRVKDDEFYTLESDVEKELVHYRKQFRGKSIYCDCDGLASGFRSFFTNVFADWGLRKLVTTCYMPGGNASAWALEAGGRPVVTLLGCDGDFRSAACAALREEADIVATNPPFSLFREYMSILLASGKKFAVIGSMNAITYKDFFPCLRDGSVRTGFTHPKKFRRQDGSLASFGNIAWFTNLDAVTPRQPLPLDGNKYYGCEEKYPAYCNYDAIECGRVRDIPGDYFGKMGVPVTFLDYYCPEQFEIIGTSRELARPMSDIAPKGTYEPGGPRFYLPSDGPGLPYRRLYDRIVIKRTENAISR